MKKYTFIKISDLSKKERSLVIDLYLLMFFETEEGQVQVIEEDEIEEFTFDSNKDLQTASKVVGLLRKYEVDGVIVDDATEVGD